MTGRVMPVMVSELKATENRYQPVRSFAVPEQARLREGAPRQLTSTSSWFAPITNPYLPAANHYLGLQ